MVPKRKVGRSLRHLLPATEHTAWFGEHAPEALQPRSSGTTGAAAPSSQGLVAGGREGVVRVDPLQLLAQQFFHPSACARQVFRMSTLPLLWSEVIRALERLDDHPAGLVVHKARPLAGRFPSEWAFSSSVCPTPKRTTSRQPLATPACSPRPSVAGPRRASGAAS